MKKKCPYCDNENLIEVQGTIYASPVYRCNNHICETFLFFKDLAHIDYIVICKHIFYIYIFKNKMDLYTKDYSVTMHLPCDSNLTPENFEQKLKTYLTFQ